MNYTQIRSVRALREAADIMETRGGYSSDARTINHALSSIEADTDNDGERLIALLLDAALNADDEAYRLMNEDNR